MPSDSDSDATNGVVLESVNDQTDQFAINEQFRRVSVSEQSIPEDRDGDDEIDGLSSPSSSGYAGERGSSSATSGSLIGDTVERDDDDDDEIEEIRNDVVVDEGNDSRSASWIPPKRNEDEVCVVNILYTYIYLFVIDWRCWLHVVSKRN